LPRNPVFLCRLDQWNWRLPPRRIEENWTRTVALLGDRGRRAGKKGRHRKGRECRVPFHENQSVLLTFWIAQNYRTSLSRFYRLGRRGRGHRQYRDYRSYHKGSHLNGSLTPRGPCEVNIQIMANPPRVIFKTDHPGSRQTCACRARTRWKYRGRGLCGFPTA
jgi:hypothetical protein